MPRYRKLHVKSVESHDINDMPDDFTRLFWVLLPLGLCREGRGLDNAAWIKSKLFPMRLDVTSAIIEGVMQWLDERGMIQRYIVDGRPYFCIPNGTWHKYQGTTIREAETEYPPPPDWTPPNSGPTQDPLTTSSGLDADADAHADAKVDADAAAQEQRGTSTPAMLMYLALYGKFQNADDLSDLLDVEGQVGSEKTRAAIQWAHSKGIQDDRRMAAICTAARNWTEHATGPPGGDGQTLAQIAADIAREFEAEEDDYG